MKRYREPHPGEVGMQREPNTGPWVKAEEALIGHLSMAYEWADARAAFLALSTTDVRQSAETLAALNRLSNAEDALYRALTKRARS